VTEGIYSYFLRGTRTEKKRTLPSAKHWRKLCPVKGLLWNSPHVACETPDQAPSRYNLAYSLLVFSAVASAFKAPFDDLSGAAAVVSLLIAALHKSWVATLFIASRRRKDASG
jgi:hypothetical protein